MCLFHKTVGDKDVRGKVTPEDVKLNTSGFDNNLDASITDVQKLADKVDDLNISSMPSGVENQTLRHDGTEWVANSILQVGTIIEYEGAEERPIALIPHIADTESDGMVAVNSNGELFNYGLIEVPDIPIGIHNFDIQSWDGTNNVWVSTNTITADGNSQGKFITKGDETTGKFLTTAVGSGGEYTELSLKSTLTGKTNNGIRLTTSEDYMDETPTGISTLSISNQVARFSLSNELADGVVINVSYGNLQKFTIGWDGTIMSDTLKGTTAALLEALPDGTIQRSTATMPATKSKIIDRVLTEDTFAFYLTTTDLDITPDLTEKIIGFEVYRKRAEQDFFSSGAATVVDKQLSYDSISFSSNDGITLGDTVRLAITYID